MLTAHAVGGGLQVNTLAPGVRLALLSDDGPTGALWSRQGTLA